MNCTVHAFGDSAFMIEGPEEISEDNFALVRSIVRAIGAAGLPGLRELIPAYRSVLAVFDPLLPGMGGIREKLERLLGSLEGVAEGEQEIVELPVCYGREFGVDLAEVASRAGISEEEVVAIHSGGCYRVFMLGFTPGFPYLGGMSERIATPRRKDPRVRIEAGSVGIAEGQTGVYPLASPGGWNIIGRSPLRLFDPDRTPPALLRAGQFVRFVPIDEATFRSLAEAENRGPGAAARENATAAQATAPGQARLEILSPGMLTTVQDRGRYGYQSTGVPPSGAMDMRSLELANIAVGNDRGEASLEMTLLGPEIRFSSETDFALAGGGLGATLSGRPVPMYEAVHAKPGEVLCVGALSSGIRSYLAVAGGFDLGSVMGSRSTYLRAGFGGFCGRQLKAGDCLGIRPRTAAARPRPVPESARPVFSESYEIRVSVSHEEDRFAAGTLQTFFSSSWSVSAKSDRMGIRLEGPELAHSRGADIISSGVLSGTIQVPGQGNPIILAADRQTTGGYPRIAHVCTVDLPVLGRLKPGDRVSFRAVTPEEAVRLAKEEAELIRKLVQGETRGAGAAPTSRERLFRVEVNGRVYAVGVAELL